jgi:hypothetical protein
MKTKILSKYTGWTRREFLQIMGLAGGALSVDPLKALEPEAPRITARPAPWTIFRLTRPWDMLAIDLELLNLRVLANSGKPAVDYRVDLL